MIKPKLLFCLSILSLALGSIASAESMTSPSGELTVTIGREGFYRISSKGTGWSLGGNLPSPAQEIILGKNKDAVGDYRQISFTFTDAERPMTGFIRLYDEKELLLFSQTLIQASVEPPSPFPNFRTFPQNLFRFSYLDQNFSPPRFDLEKNAGPWLLFDQKYDSLILSPASHFLVACMAGDGKHQLASGFNRTLGNLPAGFTQQSILVLTRGINHAFDLWGQALADWDGKIRCPNDADTILKCLGYWTDNGAAYWYNFDLKLGYRGTLQTLMDSYRRKQIPFGYLQLDSWWYDKSLTRYDGKAELPKNSKLPEGDWNRYGGTMQYKADPFLFPEGVEAFHERIGLPFATHNRWIDPASPYHQRYKFSGIAAVDPAFWDEIATYLHDNGVICYEQDWLNEIFNHSPELSSTIDQGEAFLGSMAESCKNHGLSMQYCMATPRCFLQGAKFDNLASIRVSDDHFTPNHYHDFFYVSKLADALGIWPFADVFQSTVASSALFSTLSAGPVGTGDAIDTENRANIMKIVRADGVIVKPDVPLVAMDRTYLAEAQKQDVPMLATTYTDHTGLKTIYLAAYKNKQTAADSVSISSEELGFTGPFYFFNYLTGTGVKMDKGSDCQVTLQGGSYGYYIAAPIGESGIAVLGDAGLFVGTGKKRIAALHDDGRKVTVEVILAEKEQEMTLRGYASRAPAVSVKAGSAGPVAYDATTGIFDVIVRPDMQVPVQRPGGDAIRKITVELRGKS
jgi:hypothetical protein